MIPAASNPCEAWAGGAAAIMLEASAVAAMAFNRSAFFMQSFLGCNAPLAALVAMMFRS